MCQNEADSVGLRERQHGDVHLHGGAVGGVDVKSALWTHDKQLGATHRYVPWECAAGGDLHSSARYPGVRERVSLFWACWWTSPCRTGCSQAAAAAAIWPLGQK